MARTLRQPLSEAEFTRIRSYKQALDSNNPFIKLDVLMKENDLDGKTEKLKEIYFSYYGLRPKEFFSNNEEKALDIVNKMLEEGGDYPMDRDEAISILEADPVFKEMIDEYLTKMMNEDLDEYLKERIKQTIGEKAFCPDDYLITYEEYHRRMETLSNYAGYYFGG